MTQNPSSGHSMISAESAKAFTRQLAGMYAHFPESLEYKRGVAEMAESLDLYLSPEQTDAS